MADPGGSNQDLEAPPAPPVTMSRCSSMGDSSLGLGGLEAQPMDPVVPVFKVAMVLVKECLWIEQVRASKSLGFHSKLTCHPRSSTPEHDIVVAM